MGGEKNRAKYIIINFLFVRGAPLLNNKAGAQCGTGGEVCLAKHKTRTTTMPGGCQWMNGEIL